MDKQQLGHGTSLSLREAAELLAGGSLSFHDAEVALIHAVEHGELNANIKRWATEQWDGSGLPGNVNQQETLIERADLEAWRKNRSGAER
ncbi:MAG: hypothetical protein QMB52_03115 [Propionivibrio sp.]